MGRGGRGRRTEKAERKLTLSLVDAAVKAGARLEAACERLGVSVRTVPALTPSFSRPRVSDDNPFSESLFRTLKYRPSFPDKPFDSLEHARSWVARFVSWYNTEHRHSALRFVTPDDRYFGREAALLRERHQVYQRARQLHPERWRGATRDWTPAGPVRLNPSSSSSGVESSLRLSA